MPSFSIIKPVLFQGLIYQKSRLRTALLYCIQYYKEDSVTQTFTIVQTGSLAKTWSLSKLQVLEHRAHALMCCKPMMTVLYFQKIYIYK